MNHQMFCFQCEQTVGCTGCTGALIDRVEAEHKPLILFGIRGMAAYAYHAAVPDPVLV